MNVLYISALEGGEYSGPIHSVPERINGQRKYDNVFWINLTSIDNINVLNNDLYHYISTKNFRFSKLPQPFDVPDLIVFEEFFKLKLCYIARKAENSNIPYIIVPRCQMTQNYIKNKYLKKILASFLLFNHFAQNALAVQFLTEQEKRDSEFFFHGKSFILPNGIIKQKENALIKGTPIIGTFIGRYSIWQKGLDLLLTSIEKEKAYLKKHNIIFNLYGPNDRTGSIEKIKNIVDEKNLNDLVYVNGPVYNIDKKKILLESSFFIHTSRFEGMPMAVLEALSYGLPCFVTQGSNMREEIQNYNAGWDAENTVESIKENLVELCNSTNSLTEKGRNAKNLANKYSWDSISKTCHEIYSILILNKME